MFSITPDIIARIRLSTEAEGGRHSRTPSDHFGCVFTFNEQNFDCRLLLHDVGALNPGDEARVPVKFLSPELVKPLLRIGDQFKLRDMRVIGEGTIEEILR